MPNYDVEGTRIPVHDLRVALAPHLEFSARDVVWEPIYALATHGASIAALRAVLDAHRQDPRILEVEDSDGRVFGGVWYGGRDGSCTMVYGGNGADLRVHSAVAPASVVLNQESFSIGLQSATGVALWLDEALDYGFSSPSPLFQSPGLATTHNFRCVRLEVWTPASDPARRHA